MHILPYLASGGKLPKLSACFLNSNSATPKPSVPFGVVTCNSGLTFEAARSDLTIRLLDVRDLATKKSRVCCIIHCQEVRAASRSDQRPKNSMLCLAASPSTAPSKLPWAAWPEHFVLLDEGVAPTLHSTRASTSLCCNWNKGHVYITLGIDFYGEGQPQTAETKLFRIS